MKISIISFLLAAAGSHSFAQEENPKTGVHDFIYKVITSRLEQPGGDTNRYFILQQVRSLCGTDDNCQYQAYYYIMRRFERSLNLPLAIFAGEEILIVARRLGNLRHEATTYRHLYRYYDAVGNRGLAFINSERALGLFSQLGDKEALAFSQADMLEYSLLFRKLEDVLPEMESLLDQAVTKGYTAVASNLHIRLVYLVRNAKMYEKMEEHVAALEKLPVSSPIKNSEYNWAICSTTGRADLMMVRGMLTEAEPLYQKALRLCEDKPDQWIEIKILNTLADLEWKRGNMLLAKSYLNKAQQKAEKLGIDELLVSIFRSHARVAQTERRYAEAVEFIKKQHFHDSTRQAQLNSFNIEAHFLRREKERLSTNQQNQQLKLQIRETQLLSSLLITVLFILLALGLVVGLNRQRRGRRQLAAQNILILEQAEELKGLDVAKSTFFTNISHELRTPLTLIMGPIKSALKGGHSPAQQEKLLATALHSGQQLQELVNRILDLRKLEMGKMEVHAEPTLLFAFFNSHVAKFESLAQSQSVDFSHETTVSAEAVANIDREKCRQILYNLLSNAFKFTPAGGWVSVNCSLQGNNLLLQVADSGSGIPPADLPRVFDHFFQSSRPDGPYDVGTGIGLALCQSYAKLFGGNISVESTVGKGTAFRFEFPVTLVDPSQLPQASATPETIESEVIRQVTVKAKPVAAPEEAASRPTLLVVEDNPNLQDYLRLIMEEKYHVVTAGNGQEALDSPCLATHCQLIISDLMMPVMDGYQLLEKLKSNDATRHIPVIMLTARVEAKDRLKTLRIGVDDYLTKPFDEEELLVRIDNLLRNRAARLEPDHKNGPEPVEAAVETEPTKFSANDLAWLEGFEAYIGKNLSKGTLSVPMLAFEFAMSESTLLRQVKRLTGLSTVQYLQEMRLHLARQLMENRTCDSVAKVASRVGYSDTRSFSRLFKQRYGKTPSDYING